jgi:hypothetical protein
VTFARSQALSPPTVSIRARMGFVNVPRAIVLALCLARVLCPRSSPIPARESPPNLMLWSWYAEDDFRPLANARIGVAYLALSLRLEGQTEVAPSPRTIPVQIPANTYKMAVIRFDYSLEPGSRPSFSRTQRELAVGMVSEIVAYARPQAVQIDFDAPRSAWPFYRQLLANIRDRLGPSVFLSVTALVSWCDSPQSWLAGLPVDEIVPMAFSMGQATPAIVTMLQSGGPFEFSGCRASIGVELSAGNSIPPEHRDDLLVRPRKGQRAYFFPGPQKWSPDLVLRAQRAILP